MRPDLTAVRLAIRAGETDPRTEMARSIDAAATAEFGPVFTRTFFDQARAESQAADHRSALAGLAVSVKDLFDLEGQVTAAASRVLSHAPVASADALAVARLKQAGGVVLGRTNMTEFAFSGVGINPHFGTPGNAVDAQRIPGGSSSGAAVSVATGAAFIGLGSDTGGSIRIPAALNGIVGFKSTARLVPTQGALPLSTTLDTVCAMTRSVRDAVIAHQILAARTVTPGSAPLAAYRLGVPGGLLLDHLEPAVASAFERSLATLRAAGARVEELDLPELADARSLGGLTAIEAHAWHRHLLERSGAGYDPRVRQRILNGAAAKAHDYIDLQNQRRAWIGAMERRLAGYDALLSPTVPIVAPRIDDVAPGDARDEAFFRTNALLLRNPSVINLLDGCALSLPCHAPGELPVGLMIWHGALRDDAVLAIGLLIEQALARQASA